MLEGRARLTDGGCRCNLRIFQSEISPQFPRDPLLDLEKVYWSLMSYESPLWLVLFGLGEDWGCELLSDWVVKKEVCLKDNALPVGVDIPAKVNLFSIED